jgi:hypothetical protein
MHAARALLIALLVLDCAQLAVAGLAVHQGRRRRRRDLERLARYSFQHAALLAVGAALLAIPIVLGLVGVVRPQTAVWIVIGAEAAGAFLARAVLDRLHRAAHAGA